jgi:hypothetical protein
VGSTNEDADRAWQAGLRAFDVLLLDRPEEAEH